MTPGFGDDPNYDYREVVYGIMQTLKKKVKAVNGFMLLIKSTQSFDEEMKKVVQTYVDMFGNDFWNYVIVGATYWNHDEISKKERLPVTEDSWNSKWNNYLKKNFHFEGNLPFVFVDSHANFSNELEQAKFDVEESKLWDFITKKKSSPFHINLEICHKAPDSLKTR